MAWVSDPQAVVWKGDEELPAKSRGIKVLGTPLGHEEFVADQLLRIIADHTILDDLHLGTLVACAARATYFLRVVRLESSCQFTALHDARLWRCSSHSRLPLVLGGLGLRNPVRTRAPAFWASWADVLQHDPLKAPCGRRDRLRHFRPRRLSHLPVPCQSHERLCRPGRFRASIMGFPLTRGAPIIA